MDKTGYERYGLSGNPFRDLSSESLESVDVFHVSQKIDDELGIIKEEVLDKENKAFVFLLGDHGMGKTHRLLLAAKESRENEGFSVLSNIGSDVKFTISGIIDSIVENYKDSNGKFSFSTPKWLRELIKLKKSLGNGFNPDVAGSVIVDALNSNAPCFLLLDDLQNLSNATDMDMFLRVVQIISDKTDHGILIMIGCDLQFFNGFINHFPSLNQRINRRVFIQPLSVEEACLVVAKRMLDKRMVDSIEPLYPLTESSVDMINNSAHANPRSLLKITSFVVDNAARNKAMIIDDNITNQFLQMGRNKRLNVDYQKETLESIGDSGVQSINIPISGETSIPLSNPGDDSPGFEDSYGFDNSMMNSNTPVVKTVDNPYKDISNNTGNSGVSVKKNMDVDFEDDSEDLEVKSVRVKCPKCTRVFTFEVTKKTERMRCPNPDCGFVGTIKSK